jgi:hypothetical protein
LVDHIISLLLLAFHDHPQGLSGLQGREGMILIILCLAEMVLEVSLGFWRKVTIIYFDYLMWSEFIDEVVHVDEENREVLDLLISLCVVDINSINSK